MIRKATEQDIPTLLSYGEFFWHSTPYVRAGIAYNQKCVETLLCTMIEDHYVIVVIEDDLIVGFLGVVLSALPFNDDYTVGTELFLYVHPDYRGGMAKAMMTQAEVDLYDQIDILSFGDMSTSTDMKEYYEESGFAMTERAYTKVLE